jgi:hypothetical protein
MYYNVGVVLTKFGAVGLAPGFNLKICSCRCLDRPDFGPPVCDNITLGDTVEMVLSVTLKVHNQSPVVKKQWS